MPPLCKGGVEAERAQWAIKRGFYGAAVKIWRERPALSNKFWHRKVGKGELASRRGCTPGTHYAPLQRQPLHSVLSVTLRRAPAPREAGA